MQRIPVQLITGFLGAGKTTFLNHFIQERSDERLFVIENEVGKVNVDCELVMNDSEDIADLTAGCLCCSLHDKLLDVLEEVSYRREEYDRLVIETTGVADPSSIIRTFLGNRAVERVFDLEQVICLADAKHIEQNIADTDEARRQLVSADVVLLNKCDQISNEEVETTVQNIKNIHPTATIFTGEQGEFPIADVLAVKPFHDEQTVHIDPATPSSAHRHNDITTFTLTFDRPFDLRPLAQELIKLTKLYYHQVYRIKGIIAANQTPTRVVVQSVRDSFVLSDGPPWASEAERVSHIVFIGKDVQRAAIERILERCLVKAEKERA